MEHLCVKGASSVTEVLSVAEEEAGQDLLLLNALQPQLQVLPGSSIICLHVVTQDAQHLHRVLEHITMTNSQGCERY